MQNTVTKQKNLAEGYNNSVINAISVYSTFSIMPSCDEKIPKNYHTEKIAAYAN